MALQRPQPGTIAACFLLISTGIGAVLLFIYGYREGEDKTRAALLSGATALASGFIIITGGLLTSWRTKSAQVEQATRATRQTHYANLLLLVPAYDGHRKRAHLWYNRSTTVGIRAEDEDEHSQRSLDALADAEAMESQILGALAAAGIVAGPDVSARLETLLNNFRALRPDPSREVTDLPWAEFSEAAKAELNETR